MPSSVPNPRVRVPSSGDTAGARRTSRLRSTGKLLPERDSAGRGLLDLGCWTAAACLRLLACSLQASGGETGKGTASWVGYQKLPPSLLVLILFGICISSLRPVNYVHKLYKQTCQVASMTWTQRCLQRYHYHTRT